MFRRILIFMLIGLGLPSLADNYLNSVVLSEIDGKTSVILRTDDTAKIKKEALSQDRMLVTLKNVKQAVDISALYKNISNVDGMIIQNSGNDVQILIEAPNISKSDIVFDVPNSSPIKAVDTNDENKLLWTAISVLLFVFISLKTKSANKKPRTNNIEELIKKREKEMYKNFQKEVASSHTSYKLKAYSKHVLKGETIRSYESRMAKIL